MPRAAVICSGEEEEEPGDRCDASDASGSALPVGRGAIVSSTRPLRCSQRAKSRQLTKHESIDKLSGASRGDRRRRKSDHGPAGAGV